MSAEIKIGDKGTRVVVKWQHRVRQRDREGIVVFKSKDAGTSRPGRIIVGGISPSCPQLQTRNVITPDIGKREKDECIGALPARQIGGWETKGQQKAGPGQKSSR